MTHGTEHQAETIGHGSLTESWYPRPAHPGAAVFPMLIEALKELQDNVTAAAPPKDVVLEAVESLRSVSALLRPHTVEELEQLAGQLRDMPGRAQAMAPALDIKHSDTHSATASVRFTRFYLGGNGAAHGGAVPLMFDELMGRLAHAGGRSRARTAYLNVNYRSITPVNRELHVEAHFVREEGRKRFLAATLHDGDVLCADAEGLFVALRPGQP